MHPPPRTDWAGNAHARAGPQARIASLVPSLTELLFSLGLGERVVARTGFCIHPREARRVPKVGGTKTPDLARLRSLAPTHLVANVDENRREDVDAARAFVPNVIVTHPIAPTDNLRLFDLLGSVFGCESRAAALASELNDAITLARAATAALPPERVLYLIWRRPWMTVSRDTYVSASLAVVGWETVPSRSRARYPELSDDARAWREAQRLLLSTEPYAFRERDAHELAARLRKPAQLVDGEWTSWYGSRAARGLRSLAALRTALTAERESRR